MEKKKNQCCSQLPEIPDNCGCDNIHYKPTEKILFVIEDDELLEKYLNDIKRLIPRDALERIMLCKPEPANIFMIALLQALRRESFYFEEVKGNYAPRWVPEHVAEMLIQQAYYVGKEDYNKAQSLAKERKRQHP